MCWQFPYVSRNSPLSKPNWCCLVSRVPRRTHGRALGQHTQAFHHWCKSSACSDGRLLSQYSNHTLNQTLLFLLGKEPQWLPICWHPQVQITSSPVNIWMGLQIFWQISFQMTVAAMSLFVAAAVYPAVGEHMHCFCQLLIRWGTPKSQVGLRGNRVLDKHHINTRFCCCCWVYFIFFLHVIINYAKYTG